MQIIQYVVHDLVENFQNLNIIMSNSTHDFLLHKQEEMEYWCAQRSAFCIFLVRFDYGEFGSKWTWSKEN